jgi:hypothetical protein
MSTVNYYQPAQTATLAPEVSKPVEIGLEYQPVMRGARLGYGAALLLIISLLVSFLGIPVNIHVVLLIAATIQTIGLLYLRKAPASSLAASLLTIALMIFGLGTVCMLSFMVMTQYTLNALADYLLMSSVMLWGTADVFLLLGLCRIGKSVNQPTVLKNAKLALLMLAITYALIIYLFYLLLNPSLLVSMNLTADPDAFVRFLKSSLLTISIPAVIGLVLYARTLTPLTRLAQWQLAQRAMKTNLSELGQVNVAAPGHEMDFLLS